MGTKWKEGFVGLEGAGNAAQGSGFGATAEGMHGSTAGGHCREEGPGRGKTVSKGPGTAVPGVSGTGSSTRWPALEEGPRGRLQAGKGLTVR